ncbi:MAG: LamG domain-containing protein [Flavobacteriaceae bacterium]|nr:LamG domain-containing protein [Flavobacteriaceae bacterium]
MKNLLLLTFMLVFSMSTLAQSDEQYLKFNGTNQYIEVDNNTSINPNGNQFTIIADIWLTSNKQQIIVHKWKNGNQYSLEINQGKATFVIKTSTGIHVLRSKTAIPLNKDLNIIATYDGSIMRIYEDTVFKNDKKTTGNLNVGSGPLTIGKRSESNREYLKGYIQSIGLLNVGLSKDLVTRGALDEILPRSVIFGFDQGLIPNPLPVIMDYAGQQNGIFKNYIASEQARAELSLKNYKYISVPNALSLSPTSQISLQCDIKTENTTNQVMIHKWGGSKSQFSLEIYNGKATFVFQSGTKSNVLSASSSFTINKWMRITGTYDGSTMRIYENGVEKGSLKASGLINIGDGHLTIGKRSEGNSRAGYINGSISTVALYNIALSIDQIKGNVAIQKTAYKMLFNSYKSLPTVNDLSGNGNDGTLHE